MKHTFNFLIMLITFPIALLHTFVVGAIIGAFVFTIEFLKAEKEIWIEFFNDIK